jgi:hypothetical protein
MTDRQRNLDATGTLIGAGQWFLTFGVTTLPVLGILVYGWLRQLYSVFYGTLGASPEEVGLGYQQVLALSGLSLFLIVLVIAGVYAGLLSLRKLLPWVDSDPSSSVRRETILLPSLFVGMLSLVGFFLWLYGASTADAARAFQGQAVTSVNVMAVQVLGLRAEPATVQWADKPPPGVDSISGRCLLYLGSADGRDVYFDPGPPARTIRLQTTSVVMTVIRTVPGTSGPHEFSVACRGGQVQRSPG